jgi:hypothetical protein
MDCLFSGIVIMYKLIKDPRTNQITCIQVVGENISIPLNPDNTDYQVYLKWLEEGNTPLPAEENT